MSKFEDKTNTDQAFDRIITQDRWPKRPSDYYADFAVSGAPPNPTPIAGSETDQVPFAATAASDVAGENMGWGQPRNRMNVQHPSRPRYGRGY